MTGDEYDDQVMRSTPHIPALLPLTCNSKIESISFDGRMLSSKRKRSIDSSMGVNEKMTMGIARHAGANTVQAYSPCTSPRRLRAPLSPVFKNRTSKISFAYDVQSRRTSLVGSRLVSSFGTPAGRPTSKAASTCALRKAPYFPDWPHMQMDCNPVGVEVIGDDADDELG